MTMPRCASLFAVVLGWALATSVQAQPATGKPKIVVGDTWEFLRTVTPPGRTEPTTRKVTEARTWKRWYCPQVKWIAREVLETRYFHPNAAASNTTLETLELVRFTPGK